MAAESVNLKNNKLNHKPVLLDELWALLELQPEDLYLDATAGGGGHARAFAQVIDNRHITLVDWDDSTLANLRTEFSQATFYNSNFADQVKQFQALGQRFDIILADLGISLLQLKEPARGFSFASDDVLDMRFNQLQGLTLLQLLKQVDVKQLTMVLRDYGQERYAHKIAQQIKRQHPQTTAQLAQLVVAIKKPRVGRTKLHPATQVFMALRIWTNQELASLKTFLDVAPLLLNQGGRLAIISFHSLEDRLVKSAFRDLADGNYDSLFFLKTKKPIIPSKSTLASHPQARSAKLRILQRY